MYFVEVAAEGRRRCSWRSAKRAVERSGRSSGAESQARTEVEGSRATFVEEGRREMLEEVGGRCLYCEFRAIEDGVCG